MYFTGQGNMSFVTAKAGILLEGFHYIVLAVKPRVFFSVLS